MINYILRIIIQIKRRVKDKGLFYKPDYVSHEWMRDYVSHPKDEHPYIIK